MRHRERYNSAKSHGSINLPWVADHITVFNPGPNMVLVRTTGNDEPNTPQSGDVVLLPFAARTYPVQSAQFGVRVAGFGVPLPSFSEAYPQDVELFFTAGEMPPVIADISLSTANSGVVLDTATGDSLIVQHLDIPVPPSIHRLSVVPYVFSVADVTVEITGHQTGQLYYRASGLTYSNYRPYVQISALDTSLDYLYTPLMAGAFTVTVLGYAEYGPVGVYRQDGRQLFDPLAPGATTVPVGFLTPPSTLPPSRVSVLLQTVTLRAVAGPVAWGPFTSEFVGSLFVLNKTVGDAVTMSLTEAPTSLFVLAASPASAPAASAVAIDIGPGVSAAAFASGASFARALPRSFFVLVNHSTAVAASYTVTQYPTIGA